jgi:hypothetical protein
MVRLCFIALCLLLLSGCRDATVLQEVAVSEEENLRGAAFPKKAVLRTEVREIIDDWPEFQELESSMDKLYRVENREELQLLLDELIEKEKALAESEYPELFDRPQVFSRQKVFKTHLLQVKANLEYRTKTMEAVDGMIEAYNILCNQFNVLLHSNLNTDLLSDE